MKVEELESSCSRAMQTPPDPIIIRRILNTDPDIIEMSYIIIMTHNFLKTRFQWQLINLFKTR